tara:strand:- start:233 stop:574 length:342 start_codon:yes stop_codon:yes gene_type:complete
MRKLLLLLLLFTSYVQAQYIPVYFEEEIEIKDDVENSATGTIIAKTVSNPLDFVNYGRVTNSFKATSDFDAIIEADNIYDPMPNLTIDIGTKIGRAVVRGKNNRYYIVTLYKY